MRGPGDPQNSWVAADRLVSDHRTASQEQGGTPVSPDFAKAFAAIRDELETRITRKVQAAGVMVPEGDLAQLRNVILWMTIDPELQEMLLLTALDPADWERLAPDLPKITRVFREE
jgi:hypothetical protein